MARDNEFAAYVGDLLAPLGDGAETLRIRRMFGGHGIFLGDTMFALIADDVLYFKADDQNRAEFEDAGSYIFTYMRGGRPRHISYYSAPDSALEDSEALHRWANSAIGAAKRNRKR